MKRNIAFLGLFLLSAAAATASQLKKGSPLIYAVAYGVGYGVLSFSITFAVWSLLVHVCRPARPQPDRSLFGGSNEERATRPTRP
jgi:hypothetical protein